MNDHELYRNRIRVSSLILFVMLASTFAFGDLVMDLTSHGSGMFTYAVSDTNAATVTLNTLSLTGLSGVTGVTFVSGSLLGDCASFGFCTSSFTSSSVTITIAEQFVGFFTIGSFVVDSSAPLGTVDYEIKSNLGNFSGTVGGPTVVPEPSSLLMLGSGVLSGVLARMIRRK